MNAIPPKQQKNILPDATGNHGNSPKSKPNFTIRTLIVASAIFLLLTALGVMAFLFIKSTKITSSNAYLSGGPIGVNIKAPGKITYIVTTGQSIKTGDLLLQTDPAPFEQIAEEALSMIKNLTAELPLNARKILLQEQSVNISSQALTQNIAKAREQEEQAQQALASAVSEHAALQLALRKLELKKQLLQEEKATLAKLRVEEKNSSTKLEEIKKQREQISLYRSRLEKDLGLQRNIESILKQLTDYQKEQFNAARIQIVKLNAARRDLEQCTIYSAFDALVINQPLKLGDNASFDSLALFILPEYNKTITITAFFYPGEAEKISSGMPCTVKFPEIEETFYGIVLERLPYLEDSPKSKGIPFKISLQFHEKMTGVLRQNLPAEISIKN